MAATEALLAPETLITMVATAVTAATSLSGYSSTT